MIKKLFILPLLVLFVGCTNLDDRHVFVYSIKGDAAEVANMHVIMGPGLDYTTGEAVQLPVEIEHEVYGESLPYKLEVTQSPGNVDVKIIVQIDGNVIKEDSIWSTTTSGTKMTIEGTFTD